MLERLQVMYEMLTYGFNAVLQTPIKSPLDSGKALKPQRKGNIFMLANIYPLEEREHMKNSGIFISV